MNLETEHLILRTFCESDLDAFLEYRSDPKVREFQDFQPMTRGIAEQFIDEQKDAKFGRAGERIQIAVELKVENKIIGDIYLKPESANARIVECGISFSTNYQKKGLAKESLVKILDHLFEDKNIHRVFGIVDVENEACIRLIESLSFRREAEFKLSFWDQAKNEWRDEYLYAMLKQDWLK
jgi:RimJ/RimL family protein N-acetyltransferase